tara:strand:- start:2283 stop:2456 length:174 start_codon:yes stop_codon:yes gene_type:complete
MTNGATVLEPVMVRRPFAMTKEEIKVLINKNTKIIVLFVMAVFLTIQVKVQSSRQQW